MSLFDFERATIYPTNDHPGWTVQKIRKDRWKVMKSVMLNKQSTHPYNCLVYYVYLDNDGQIISGENGWLVSFPMPIAKEDFDWFQNDIKHLFRFVEWDEKQYEK